MNQIEIVKKVLSEVEQIGGIPSNPFFYEEFDYRLRVALGLPLSESFKPETAKDLPNFKGETKISGDEKELLAVLGKPMIRKHTSKDFDENVNSPTHYNQYPIETIDMMVAVFGKEKTADFCLINAFKYRMRMGRKDDVAQDLAKEQWYLNKYKQLIFNN
jgi:hypothetical protein